MRKTATITFIIGALLIIAGAVESKQRGADLSSEQITADSLLSEADRIFQSRDYQSAMEQYHRALDRAREEFNRSVEVEALSQVARMNLLLDKKEDGRSLS